MEQKKLSFGKMLGYSLGAWGDYTAYGFIFNFLSFFLTTVAGVSPAVSGVIISIAIAWDAVTDPVLGMMMDSSKCKHGKRRPFILASIAPLGASIVLLFLNVNLPPAQKSIYYIVMVLVFWTAYTMYNIPYYSLGSVVTRDDGERTKVSGIRQVTGFVGTFCASTLPTFLIGKLLERGVATDTAWLYVAVVAAVIVVVTLLVMWRSTRGLEPIEAVEKIEKKTIRTLLGEIGCAMRFKPYLLIIAAALFMNVNMTLFNSSVMYFTVYNLGLGEAQASTIFLANTITSIGMAFVLTKLGLVFDKKHVFIGCMWLSGIVMILAKFITVTSLPMAIGYMVLASIGPAAYWMFIFNFVYDVMDADEYQTGVRKDGIYISYYSFLLKLGGAVASLVLGFLLDAGGFVADAPQQTAQALGAIENLFTILPGIFVFGSGLAMCFTPLTRKYMRSIQDGQVAAKQ